MAARILIVEDEPAFADVLAELLREEGYSVMQVRDGFTALNMLGGERATLVTALVGVVLAWASIVVPAVAAVGCAQGQGHACIALVPALMGSGAAFGLHLAGTFYFGIPFWYGFLFPLGYTVGAAMACDSLRRRRRGGVTWKGRTYPH